MSAPRPKAGVDLKRQRAVDLARRDPDLSRRQIAERLGVALTTVEVWLKAPRGPSDVPTLEEG
jgi:hypothetical protein